MLVSPTGGRLAVRGWRVTGPVSQSPPDLRLYPYPDCGNLRAPLLQPGKQGRHHLPHPRSRRAMRGQQQQCRFRLRAPVVMFDTGHGDPVLQAAGQERQDFRFQ